jgi:hypothetical protein
MINMDTKNSTISGKSQPVGPQFTNGLLDSLDGRLGIARELRQRFEAMTGGLGRLCESILCRAEFMRAGVMARILAFQAGIRTGEWWRV